MPLLTSCLKHSLASRHVRMLNTVARILNKKEHLVPGKLNVTEILFEVPIDYAAPSKGTIQLFARSVTKNEKPAAEQPEDEKRKAKILPWLVYLQGGPGHGCSPPQDSPLTSLVLNRGYQLLYLDQRGTGLSSPITADTLNILGNPESQAEYLKFFRADSIVKDCEAVRRALTADYPEHLKKWSIFGQSFGGFCVLTYLSKFPQGLREAFTTGGLPPINKSPEQVYAATYKKVIERNQAYYGKFPEDINSVHELAYHIKSQGGLKLPSGSTLTVRLFLSLGRSFGFHGGLDSVHDLIYRMKLDLAQFQFITRPTLSELEAAVTLETAVIYAVLHEAIYCQRVASNWAAERVGKSLAEFRWLAGSPDSPAAIRENPLFFSGEMIYPFMFEVFPELEKLAPAAKIIAQFSDWPELYDEWQLAKNEVPLYALTYIDDMYVDYGLAQDTVKLVKNCKQAVTNGMYHNATRSRSKEAFEALFALRDDNLD